MQGNMFIVVAPSGAGKTSLVEALLKTDDKIRLSISHTTRAPRVNEQDGKDYHFIDEISFRQRIADGEFLEHAEVYGNYYGTNKLTVQSLLNQGYDVLLEIDWQGFALVKSQLPQAISIFILPPSLAELARRLRKRGTDAEEVIQKRLAVAHMEIDRMSNYDFTIVNEDFDTAALALQTIVKASRLSTAVQLKALRQRFPPLVDAAQA
jgi:guanylate kinase